jgi:opacity protein-like surface antigen
MPGTETRPIILLVLLNASCSALAQSEIPWDGGYFGVNVGDASSKACGTWTPNGAELAPGSAAMVSNRSCAAGANFLGGLQVGENFQSKRLVWGIGLDLDAAASNTAPHSVKVTGGPPPPGTYVVSGRQSPNGFAVVGPRVGYAGDVWLPYLRGGTIIADGSHAGMLSFTPAGAAKPSVSFTGARNFSTIGWVAGAGTEIGLNGPWSITVEYLHVNLGKGSGATAVCSGSAAACAAFSGISFDSVHDGFAANIYRIGVTYWFGY